jgi:hypothetical protein
MALFFRKDTPNKLDQQVELLQAQAQELQRQLTAEQAQVLIKTGLAEQLQEDMELLESDLRAAYATLEGLQQGGQGEIAQLAASNKQLHSEMESLVHRAEGAEKATATLEAEKSELAASNTLLEAQIAALQAETEKQIAKLHAELEAAQAGHRQAQERLGEHRKQQAEMEKQIAGLHAELEAAHVGRRQVQEQLDEHREQLGQADSQSGSQIKQLQSAKTYLQDKLAAAEKDTQKYKGELAVARQDADAAVSKARADAAMAQDGAVKEIAALRRQLQAKGGTAAAAQGSPEAQTKQAMQLQAQYEDAAQENELLLLQLMQAQEELVEYYEEKGRFEQLYEAMKARWERLEARLPNYVDYGAIELLSFDNLSETPSVTWRVKDFAQAGAVVPEFVFQTVLQDGQPGIGLFLDTAGEVLDGIALVPKLIASSAAQVEKFVALSSTDFRKVSAAAIILAQQEASQWQGFAFPAQFDPSFWRPSLKLLAAQLQSLPAVLRYDAVKLKRELINPDYEHLWVELQGVVFGARTWKKLEARLGAAMVQPEGFSQFPKFEIPLIDGKHKPFESWYAESYDDAGAKLELRFALEKNVLDGGVLAKLDDADRVLILRLVYAFPDLIKRLEAQQVSIHRPWATWADFAKGAVRVLELQRQQQSQARAAEKQLADAKNAAVVDGAAPEDVHTKGEQILDALPQPAIRPAVKTGPRVISIGNKSAARPAAKATTAPANVPPKVPKAAKLSAPDEHSKPAKASKVAVKATRAKPKPSKVAIANA